MMRSAACLACILILLVGIGARDSQAQITTGVIDYGPGPHCDDRPPHPGRAGKPQRVLSVLGVEHIGILVKSLQAAPDEATRNQSIQTFVQSGRFRVFDMERQQYVDEKDFMNKDFAGG